MKGVEEKKWLDIRKELDIGTKILHYSIMAHGPHSVGRRARDVF